MTIEISQQEAEIREKQRKEELMMKFATTFRYNEDFQFMINWLLRNRPVKYFNESHLIRCAIIKLYAQEKEDLQNA